TAPAFGQASPWEPRFPAERSAIAFGCSGCCRRSSRHLVSSPVILSADPPRHFKAISPRSPAAEFVADHFLPPLEADWPLGACGGRFRRRSLFGDLRQALGA